MNNLSKELYESGSRLSLENAEQHMRVALVIAEKTQNYGFAVSHIILGCEELAKAAILRIKSLNETLTIANLKDYFRHHPTKHKAFFFIYNAIKNNGPHNEAEITSDKKLGLALLIIILLAIATNPTSVKQFEKEINHIIDKMRNFGFYVGYIDDWHTPNSFYSESSYSKIREIAAQAFYSIKEFLFEKNPDKAALDTIMKALLELD